MIFVGFRIVNNIIFNDILDNALGIDTFADNIWLLPETILSNIESSKPENEPEQNNDCS